MKYLAGRSLTMMEPEAALLLSTRRAATPIALERLRAYALLEGLDALPTSAAAIEPPAPAPGWADRSSARRGRGSLPEPVVVFPRAVRAAECAP